MSTREETLGGRTDGCRCLSPVATGGVKRKLEIGVKRILVAVDGSRAADKALEVALDLAALYEAEIRLL